MSSMLNMNNIAYTKKYIKARADDEARLFNPLTYKSEQHYKLTDELVRVLKNYEKYPEKPGFFSCSINEIINSSGNVIYSYSCIDNSSDFCTVITHENGKKYIVFRRDLYGYSVLDLHSMEDFHYIPAESFKPPGETFIWCRVHYNHGNSILAVEGCFWGAPFSVTLVDFSNPMQTATQIYINDYINKDFEKYDDIDFVEWKNNDLFLSVTDNGEYKIDTNQIIIKQKEYLDWFKTEI